MEFSTLTRRVADYAQIDPSDIEPDAGTKSGASVFTTLPLAEKVDESGNVATAPSVSGDLFARAGIPAPPSPASGRGTVPNTGRSLGKGDKSNVVLTPQALAAARAEAARKTRIDRGKYKTIRNLEERKSWLARVHDFGQLAIEDKADSIDPMQAEICGIALALAPNDACYIPVSHKHSGDGSGLFAAGLAPDQITTAAAVGALRQLLESAGILKVGFNLKFRSVILGQQRVTIHD